MREIDIRCETKDEYRGVLRACRIETYECHRAKRLLLRLCLCLAVTLAVSLYFNIN